MESTSIPMSHITMWLTILGLFITAACMSFSAAWVGVKLALKPLKVEIDSIKEARAERGLAITELQRAVQLRVLIADCAGNRIECGRNRSELTCLSSAHMENLTEEVVKNSKLLVALSATFEERTKHFDILSDLITSRAKAFRSPTEGDKMQ